MPTSTEKPADGAAKLVGKYELSRLLGSGSSAKVYLARNIRTGEPAAIKCFTKLGGVSQTLLAEHIKREILILRRLRHPHIIHLHEVLASRSKIYLVLDLVKGGELFARVSTAGRLSENLSRRYFHQLISAVQHCHSRGVFHRDLKLENLLLDEDGDLKVSDFGLSAIAEQIKPDGLFHTICGTPAYVAPEILSRKGYAAATVDLWSCGIILFVLVAGYLPFNDSNIMSLYRKIYRGEFKCPVWVSSELRHLISRLLDKNPDTRITVEEILEHPWYRRGVEERSKSDVGDCGEMSKAEAVEREERQLNAFDIIGFSTGADLSGMFGGSLRERFVSGEAPAAVLRRVEEKGRREGMVVRRKGGIGVGVWGQKGNLVVGMEVYRLSGELAVFEVERGRVGEGMEGWGGEFWRSDRM